MKLSIVRAFIVWQAATLCLAATPTLQETNVFTSGVDGYADYRIPALVTATDGTLLAFAEGRTSLADDAAKSIVLKRSSDGGQTWQNLQVVVPTGSITDPSGTAVSIGNETPVVDSRTGTIVMPFTVDTKYVYVTTSTNNGATWSTPVNITTQVWNTAWGSYTGNVATGPGNGIQMANGRIVIPADLRENGESSTSPSYSYTFYSDDDGVTWQYGTRNATLGTNESAIAETSPGTLYMSSRARTYSGYTGTTNRWSSVSTDGGANWTAAQQNPSITDPSAQGSLLQYTGNSSLGNSPLLLSNLNDGTNRDNLTIRASKDQGQTWSNGRTVYFGQSGYSDMSQGADGSVDMLFEAGRQTLSANTVGPTQTITFARTTTSWLSSTAPYTAFWQMNEQTNGPASTVDGAIKDSGGWNIHATAFGGPPMANDPPVYPTYVSGDPRLGGSALQFTTGPDYVMIGGNDAGKLLNFAASDSFTIEADIRTTQHASGGQSGAGAVITHSDPSQQTAAWYVQVENGKLDFVVEDDGGTTSEVLGNDFISDGAWHTIAAERDATDHELRLYVDCILVGSAPDNSTMDLLDGSNYIDTLISEFTGGVGHFNGDISDVRITEAALDPSQMLLSNVTSVPEPSGFVIASVMAILLAAGTFGWGLLLRLRRQLWPSRAVATGLATIATWLVLAQSAWAQQAATGPKVEKGYTKSYALVVLAIALGMLIVCRSANRKTEVEASDEDD